MNQAEYDRYKLYLERIDKYGVNLSEWDTTFVESLRVKFERYPASAIHLSDRQIEQLERIYRERTPYDIGR